MSGYISDVSPVRTYFNFAKDHKRKCFIFTLTNDVTSHHDMCFSPEKYELFNTVAQEEIPINGLEIKRFKSAPLNKDIRVTDFSSEKKTELTFEKNIINVFVLVFNLQEQITVKTEVKDLRLRKAILKDNRDKNLGVFFESTMDEISEGACYNLTKTRVQKYHDERVLESTENTEVSENTTLGLVKIVKDDKDVPFDETKIAAEVVSIDLKTLTQTYQCSKCTAPVTIQNGLAWCDACNHVSSQTVCKAKAYVIVGVVTDTDPLRCRIKISHFPLRKNLILLYQMSQIKTLLPNLLIKGFCSLLTKPINCKIC